MDDGGGAWCTVTITGFLSTAKGHLWRIRLHRGRTHPFSHKSSSRRVPVLWFCRNLGSSQWLLDLPRNSSYSSNVIAKCLLQGSARFPLLTSSFFFFFWFFFFSELGTEPRALHFLGKRSTTELNPQPRSLHPFMQPQIPQQTGLIRLFARGTDTLKKYFLKGGKALYPELTRAHIFCIHSSVEGDLGCLQLLDIINKAALSIVEHVSLLYVGASFGYMPKRGIAGSSGSAMSNFLRNLQSDYQNGCTSLQSHQQWTSVPLSPHPRQHLLSPEFLILAILTGVR